MRREAIVLPLLLIAAGVILLLKNLGHLPWTVWELLAKLWPVLLIALGLDILFGRSALRWALGIALALLVALAVLLALRGPPSEEVAPEAACPPATMAAVLSAPSQGEAG